MPSPKALRPRLFLAGAPKAGTSALGAFLAQHPEVAMSRPKEPNWFCPDFDLPRPRSEAEYLSLFAPDAGTRILADGSVLYLYSTEAARRIAAWADDPRILLVLRDPVEAMAAWHAQMVYTGNEPIADFAEALAAEPDRRAGRRLPAAGTGARCPALLLYSEVMRYAPQLERYLAAFDRAQLLVLRYDEFRADPVPTYRRVCAFAGIDPDFRPSFEEMNPPKVRRAPGLHRALKRVLAAPSRALPLGLRLRLIQGLDRLTSRTQGREGPETDLRERLAARCAPDVARLGELLGRDFSDWSATRPRPGAGAERVAAG